MSAPQLPTFPSAPATLPSAAPLDGGSFRPHPPEIVDLGRKPGQDASQPLAESGCEDGSQAMLAVGIRVAASEAEPLSTSGAGGDVFEQQLPAAGRQLSELPATVREGLALIDEARPPRNLGGRPRVIDDVAKIKIATLMATGASLRQVAGFLGVSHSTVSAAIAADPALKQEIDAARQRAVLHPLACIVRESGRNWKAAAWLMDYLNKQANRELPADDRNREEAESKAAVMIQNDLACEIRQQAKTQREAQKRREEDEQWRREIAQQKARKLARAQQQQTAAGAAPTAPPQAATPS